MRIEKFLNQIRVVFADEGFITSQSVEAFILFRIYRILERMELALSSHNEPNDPGQEIDQAD